MLKILTAIIQNKRTARIFNIMFKANDANSQNKMSHFPSVGLFLDKVHLPCPEELGEVVILTLVRIIEKAIC